MNRPIDIETLERSLVSYGSPTLAGIKPAALFTFPGTFDCDRHAEPSAKRAVVERREQLSAVVDQASRKLAAAGIELRILVWRSCGALIYAWRPTALARALADARATELLRSEGYDLADTDACISHLAARIAAASKRSDATCALDRACAESCPCAFPHEVGFFLGYPAEDVLGFIEHDGRNFLALGPWKVYANLEHALATFEGYRRCTERCRRRYASGHSLSELARTC